MTSAYKSQATPVRPGKSSKTSKAVNGDKVTKHFSTHQELLADMEEFRKKTLSTPGAARQFLIDTGLLTKSGKVRQLIRD